MTLIRSGKVQCDHCNDECGERDYDALSLWSRVTVTPWRVTRGITPTLRLDVCPKCIGNLGWVQGIDPATSTRHPVQPDRATPLTVESVDNEWVTVTWLDDNGVEQRGRVRADQLVRREYDA